MENVSKYCTYASKFNQNCEITKAPGGALQNDGQRLCAGNQSKVHKK
jgi:hypothetical protein